MCFAMAWPWVGPVEECAEDKEIERASQQFNVGRRLASHCVDILLLIM